MQTDNESNRALDHVLQVLKYTLLMAGISGRNAQNHLFSSIHNFSMLPMFSVEEKTEIIYAYLVG